jgi:hypothetical protein
MMILRKLYLQKSKRMLHLLSKPKHQLTVEERRELQEYLNDSQSSSKRKVTI